MNAATVRRLFEYNEKVFDRFVRSSRRLPWKVASRDRGIGHRSIFRTLVHVLNVHEVWLQYIVPGRSRELESLFRDDRRAPKDWRGFDAYAARVWEGIRSWTREVKDADLAKRVRAPWMPGRYTAGDAALQTSFEQAHHLGEIIGVSWQGNREPPEMTWIDVNRGR